MQYVYILRAGEDHYKVGVAKNVSKRVQSLQTSNPHMINVIATRIVTDALAVEANLHRTLSSFRTDGGTEWFKLSPMRAIELAEALARFPQPDVLDRALFMNELKRTRQAQLTIEAKVDYLIGHLTPMERVRSEPKVAPAKEPAAAKPTAEERDASDAEIALAIFRTEGKASTSLLQRRLGIGYGRAARVIERLEQAGHIGPSDGARARVVVDLTLPSPADHSDTANRGQPENP